jgi:hypothetical protein
MHEKQTSMDDVECALLEREVLCDVEEMEFDILRQQYTETAISHVRTCERTKYSLLQSWRYICRKYFSIGKVIGCIDGPEVLSQNRPSKVGSNVRTMLHSRTCNFRQIYASSV